MATGEITSPITLVVNSISLDVPVSGVPAGSVCSVKLTGKPLTSVGDVDVKLAVAITVTGPDGGVALAFTQTETDDTALLGTHQFVTGNFNAGYYGVYTIAAALYDAAAPTVALDTYAGTLFVTEDEPAASGIGGMLEAIMPIIVLMMMMGMMMPMMRGIGGGTKQLR